MGVLIFVCIALVVIGIIFAAVGSGEDEEVIQSRSNTVNQLKSKLDSDFRVNPISVEKGISQSEINNNIQEYTGDSLVDKLDSNFSGYTLSPEFTVDISPIKLEKGYLQDTEESSPSNLGSFNISQEYTENSLKRTILIDEKNKNIAFFLRETGMTEVYDYKDILKAEIVEDGKAVTSTSRGSQLGGVLIGGLLAGGVGAVIGGLSSKTTSDIEIKKLDLKIVVNDSIDPIKVINFMGDGISEHSLKPPFRTKNDPELIKAKEKIEHWHTLLSILINHDNENNKKAIPLSFADELLKLSELRNQGILTEEEFNTLKSQLINN